MARGRDREPTIVILGGYGEIGGRICNLLASFATFHLVIAGRRLDAGVRFADAVRQRQRGGSVEAIAVDAACPASLAPVLASADLLIVAAPVDDHIGVLVRSCVAARCHYIDVLHSPAPTATLRALASDIDNAGILCVPHAGLCPGLPAVLLHRIRSMFDECRSIRLGVSIRLKGFTAKQAFGFIDAAADTGAPGGLSQSRALIDYGPPFGVRTSVPLALEELEGVAERLDVREVTAYSASPDWRLEALFRTLVCTLYRIRRGFGRSILAKLLVRAGNRSTLPPGATLVAEASGTRRGERMHGRLCLSHTNVFDLTAVSAAVLAHACVLDEGRLLIRAGLHPMGSVLRAEAAFAELRRFGTIIEQQQIVGDGVVSEPAAQGGSRGWGKL